MSEHSNIKGKTLIILSPAWPGNETDEQSPWLPAKQSLVRSLNRNFPGLEIIILVFQFPTDKTEYRWNGNRVIPFGGANKRRGHNLFLWFKVFRQLMRLRKQKELAGIITFWCGECCLVGSYFSRLYHVKHLCWISGLDATKSNKFVKRIRPKANELATMSDFLMDEFGKNHGIRPKYVIPDAIDTSLFNAHPQQRTIDILGAGNLVTIKRYDLFIQVVAAIIQQRGNTNTALCGDGTEKENIKEQVIRAGLNDTISLTGLIPQKQVLGLMQQTKLFLHTSIYEGFGNVCIEALYAGAHVISFTRPMKQDIPHWHIVATKEEMIAKALEILENDKTDYTPVLPFDMNDSAKMFMKILSD